MLSLKFWRFYRKIVNALFGVLVLTATASILIPLFLILKFVFLKGVSSINLDFFTHLPTPVGTPGGGMKHAILGTITMVFMGSLMAIPVGILTGVYLSEFRKTLSVRFIKIVVELLSGIPSIVIGIFAYLMIVVPLKSFSAFAGSVALSLIMLPTIIKTSEEIFLLIPNHLREAGLALGLRRYHVIFSIVIKGSLKSLITGIILSISRSAGETAPLLFTAFGSMYFSFNINEPMASLPVQIYTYAISPFKEWHDLAWAGSLVLVVIVLGLNLSAKFLVRRMGK